MPRRKLCLKNGGESPPGARPISFSSVVQWSLKRACRIPQKLLDDRLHPRARGPAARFRVEDRSRIEPGERRQFGLSQAESAAERAKLVSKDVRVELRVVPEDLDNERPVPDRGLVSPEFPSRHGFAGNAPALSDGSLRQAEIEPAATDVLPERGGRCRVTSWEHARSGALEPEAGKRQRNSALAAGSGIPSAAAGAARAT